MLRFAATASTASGGRVVSKKQSENLSERRRRSMYWAAQCAESSSMSANRLPYHGW